MKDEKNLPAEEQELEEELIDIITLTDEEGTEHEFEVLLTEVIDGNTYIALVPIGEDETDDPEEYVLLKVVKAQDGEEELVSIDDDAEFESVEAIFNEKLFSEYDYDEDEEE